MHNVLVPAVLLLFAAFAAGAEVPRAEHPRPDMVRTEWSNLNGTWEFAETDDSADESFLTAPTFPDKIVVPFCRESKLSGLARTGFIKNVWYRRTFERPAAWKSPRTLLHIGACDWYTRVYVNGTLAGEHKGGSAPITVEVTHFLKPGANTVIVRAFDDTRSGIQALGKQCTELKSFGCLYTRTTGIWQTVWLEGVGSSYLESFRIEPDTVGGRFTVRADVNGDPNGLQLRAEAFDDKKLVASAEVPADWRNGRATLNLSEKKLWSPKTPFLYNIRLTLKRSGKVVDRVMTYAGLRDITIRGAAILINGKPYFQRLVLDQGFYPDGIWTAPSEAALKHDIELSRAAGFNGARLHQKVFEPRYLYWADRMGYMVWGEFPNWGLNYANPASHLPVMQEWNEIVRRDRNHPAIVGWCPFNETPSEAVPIQNAVVNMTRELDPSRPVIDSSGWTHGLPNPEVLDQHDYDQNPTTFRERWTNGTSSAMPLRYGGSGTFDRPFMVSEFGGIGYSIGEGWGYGNAPKTLEEYYTRFAGLCAALLDNPRMFGYCYTQLTDVEQERNGIYTYQRTKKFDIKRIHDAQVRPAKFETEPLSVSTSQVVTPNWRVLVGAVPDGKLAKPWRFTTTEPEGSWKLAGFDDAGWQEGLAGFGAKEGWEASTRTPWTTKDLWVRQTVKFDGAPFNRALLAIHYDNAAEVYVNGTEIWQAQPGTWNSRYEGFDVTKAVKGALKPGENTVAIHIHQDTGGQFLDAALLVAADKTSH